LRISQEAGDLEFAYLVIETAVSLLVNALDHELLFTLLPSKQERDSGLGMSTS
jgi:hypothetical protein